MSNDDLLIILAPRHSEAMRFIRDFKLPPNTPSIALESLRALDRLRGLRGFKYVLCGDWEMFPFRLVNQLKFFLEHAEAKNVTYEFDEMDLYFPEKKKKRKVKSKELPDGKE